METVTNPRCASFRAQVWTSSVSIAIAGLESAAVDADSGGSLEAGVRRRGLPQICSGMRIGRSGSEQQPHCQRVQSSKGPGKDSRKLRLYTEE